MSDVNVTIDVKARELDPSKSYIVEVKNEVTQDVAMGLVNALQQLGIKHVLVTTPSGEAINVVELPEPRSTGKEVN